MSTPEPADEERADILRSWFEPHDGLDSQLRLQLVLSCLQTTIVDSVRGYRVYFDVRPRVPSWKRHYSVHATHRRDDLHWGAAHVTQIWVLLFEPSRSDILDCLAGAAHLATTSELAHSRCAGNHGHVDMAEYGWQATSHAFRRQH